MDLLKASSLGSAACLDQKRTRYPILKECFTPRSTFYASVLESCILRPGHAREVSHSHNRIHREFSIMFQLTSMGKHDAITRDHSVQMKRHFLVQPQCNPFPKLACSVGPQETWQFSSPSPSQFESVGRRKAAANYGRCHRQNPRDNN